METLNGMNIDSVTQETIDNVTNKLASIFIDTAQSIGLCKESREKKYFKSKSYSRRHPHYEWFDEV